MKKDRSEGRGEGLGQKIELERGQLFQAFVEEGRSDLSSLFFGPGEPLSVKILHREKEEQRLYIYI